MHREERYSDQTGIGGLHWSRQGNHVELSQLEYPDLFRICANEEEVIGLVSECADQGSPTFRVYFEPDYAKELFADEHYGLHRLMAKTRLKHPSLYQYNEECCYVLCEESEYYAAGRNSSWADTLEDFMEILFRSQQQDGERF